MSKTIKSELNLTKEQKENFTKDQQMINEMYDYRSYEEADWIKAARKWNLLSSVTNSFFIPAVRNATHTGIVAKTQALPRIGLVPEDPDDRSLISLIKDAETHIANVSNDAEMYDQLMVDLSVLGNAVIEDYIEYNYKCKRNKKLNKKGHATGNWTKTYERDFSKSKIGSRARSPWECAFNTGSRTVSQITACTFRDVITEEEFEANYKYGNKDLYFNTEYVETGMVFSFNNDGEPVYQPKEDKRIVIQHFQDEEQDVYRKYANGVLIMDESLSDFHAHGKCTLTLITQHHMYDRNLKSHRLYGVGDPKLLEDLDDLLNAMVNQFITNYELKNKFVLGIEGYQGDIEDINLESGDIFFGKVNIQNFGVADLPEFISFKQEVEEMMIQTVKKNFKRLEGEVSKTAYEARQKQKAENMGMLHELRRIENVGLRSHKMKRISDIFEYMTEEEIMDVSEKTAEEIESIAGDRVAKHEKVYDKESGKLIQIKYRERFVTKGTVYQVKMIDGKPHRDGLREDLDMAGNDGILPAYPQFFWTREWLTRRQIPLVYIVSGTVLGEDNFEKMELLNQTSDFIVKMQNIEAQQEQFKSKIKIDVQNISEQYIDAADQRRDSILENGTEIEGLAKEQEIIDTMRNVLETPPMELQATGVSAAGVQGLPQQVEQGANRGNTMVAPETQNLI